MLLQGREEPARFKACEHVRWHRWCKGSCLLSRPCHRWREVLVQCARVEVFATVDPVDGCVPYLEHLWCGCCFRLWRFWLFPCGVEGRECAEYPRLLAPGGCCHCRLLARGRWLGHFFCRRCGCLSHLLPQADVHCRGWSHVTGIIRRCCRAQCAFRVRWARCCLCRWQFLLANWACDRELCHHGGQ